MRNINPFGLRLQPELKAQLEQAASKNKRSLNAEITARLQESFRPSDSEGTTPALRMLRKLHEESQARLAELRAIRKPTHMELIELEHEERAAKNLRHTIARSLQLLTESFPQADEDEATTANPGVKHDPDMKIPTSVKRVKRSRPLGVDPNK